MSGPELLRSTAVVVTDSSRRYAKQVLSHLGHKVTVQPLPGQPEPAGQLVFSYGVGTVLPLEGRLVLGASAATAESLARVQDVIKRHLEKFGARRELVVTWGPADPDTADETQTDAAGQGSAGPSPEAASGTAADPTREEKTSSVRVIRTDAAPSHVGPVPQAVEAGGWIYVSALFGADPVGHAIPEDPRGEAEQVFTNLEAILAAAGASLTDVVRVGIVMRDLQRDRPVFNDVWAERFGDHRPARSAIQSPDFGRTGENARFMIEATAFRG